MAIGGKLTANVELRNGVPFLRINGRATPPLMFFFNTEVPEGVSHLEPQVKLAAEAGIHLYSLCLPYPWPGDGAADYSEGERMLQAFVDADHEALFIPRMRCEGPDEWLEAHPDARVRFSDGSSPLMSSMASHEWWRSLEPALERAIRHFEDGPFGDRIVAYHPAGQNSNEWFHFLYWLNGPDHSEANHEGFRAWLRRRYESDEALSAAWGRSPACLDDATIPLPLPALPAEEGTAGEPFDVFLNLPAEQDWADFHDYTNEIVADRLIDIARIIKRAAPHKLVLVFYGYAFEMHGATSGHFAMERVLRCPSIDLISSPLSYLDRQVGGSGSFMTAVDSLPLHNKLWIVENDYRTHSIRVDKLPWFITEEGLGPRAQTRAETLSVVAREFGSLLAHRCGTWWMDLIAAGAFEDPAVWQLVREQLAPLYEDLLNDPAPYRPDVGIIVDEAALRLMRFPAVPDQAAYNPVYDRLYRYGRDAFGRSGAACGWYYIDDFLEGRSPRCRVYWFLNAALDDPSRLQQCRARLEADKAAAVWQYSAGHPRLGDPAGFDLAVDAGALGSRGAGPLAGLEWGDGYVVRPRLRVCDEQAEVLGTYRDGGGVSTAVRTSDHGAATAFVGDIRLTPEVVRRLLAHLGAHIWAEDAAVQTDGRVLFVHASGDGPKALHLPPNLRVLPVGPPRPGDGATCKVFNKGETRIFRLTAAEGEPMP